MDSELHLHSHLCDNFAGFRTAGLVTLRFLDKVIEQNLEVDVFGLVRRFRELVRSE